MEIKKLFDRLNAGEHASRALRVTAEDISCLPATVLFRVPEE